MKYLLLETNLAQVNVCQQNIDVEHRTLGTYGGFKRGHFHEKSPYQRSPLVVFATSEVDIFPRYDVCEHFHKWW